MKLVVDIADNKEASFMELIKGHSYVKAKPLSIPDEQLLEEIKEITKAFKHVDLIKAGKLKTRPIEDLLNEI